MITEAPFQQTWTLQGRICGQWAVDLQRVWDAQRSLRAGRQCVVDLEGVQCVDAAGEAALSAMAAEGARLVATRAYMKYVIESLLANHGQKD